MERRVKLYCPFCSEPITPDTIKCPSCDNSYSSETFSFIKRSQKWQDEYHHEQRKHVRFPIKLKVTSSTPEAFIDRYTSNVSLGGLFLDTNAVLPPGKRFDLKMFLFDMAGPMQVPCEVAWSRNEEKLTPVGRLPRGMGVKFLNLPAENIQRLIDISNRSLS